MLTPKHFLQVSVRIIWAPLCNPKSKKHIKTDVWLASPSDESVPISLNTQNPNQSDVRKPIAKLLQQSFFLEVPPFEVDCGSKNVA